MAKIHLVDEYTEQFESAENINEAYETGNYLEQKRDFFLARSSMFKLKQFARRNTPFRKEAQQLVKEMKKGMNVVSEFTKADEPEPSEPKKKERTSGKEATSSKET